MLGDELRRELTHSPALWFAFGSLAAGHFWKAFQSGYDAMPDKELKQRVPRDVYLLILRAMAMFVMAAHGLAFFLVPLLALLLSYFELGPSAHSVRSSAIRRACTNTIRTILRRADADADGRKFPTSSFCLLWRAVASCEGG